MIFFAGPWQMPFSADGGSVLAGPPQLVSLDYNNANLSSVLKALAYSYDFNIVISKSVSGKVSAKLKNISIDEALTAFLDVNGYAFYRKDKIVYIMSKSEAELATESLPLSYLAVKDAKELLGKAISSKGDIQTIIATNSLVVRDYPQNIGEIKALLKEIDLPPMQVLIEARIVDIKTAEVEKIGTSITSKVTPPHGSLQSAEFNTGSSAKDTDGGQLLLTPNLKYLAANVTIDALVQSDKARVLASPSIATLTGQEAKIIIGDRVPYKSTQTSISGSSGGITNTSGTSYVEVGTSLRVTPMVSPDGWITMKIHPEVSTVTGYSSDGAPLIGTREADATVRVKDNETIIIGGLISKNEDRSRNGVPGIRNVPVLGWFFQRRADTDQTSELTVFITPHIIRSTQPMVFDKPGAQPGVYVESKSLEPDMDLLSGLLTYAASLEKDVSKKPADDLYLYSELIKTYKTILQHFPNSGKSDFCLYKVAALYVKGFHKCEAAGEALAKMRENFPNSSYIDTTEMFVNACQEVVGRKSKDAAAKGP